MAKIKMSLSTDNIDFICRYLEKREQIIKQKSDILAKRLAELGRDIADLKYGDEEVTVSVVKKRNTYEIHANGKEVCFIEFGAGVRTNSSHPYADKMPFDVKPGSWSIQDKQQFVTKGYWYYGGKKMNSIEPHNAMYLASRHIQEQVYKIAKEVFDD